MRLKTPPTSFLPHVVYQTILQHDFLYFTTVLIGELASSFFKHTAMLSCFNMLHQHTAFCVTHSRIGLCVAQ